MMKTINFKVSEIAIRGSPNAYVSNPIVGLSAAVLKIWLTEDTYVPSCTTSLGWNFTAFCCRICQ